MTYREIAERRFQPNTPTQNTIAAIIIKQTKNIGIMQK